MIFWMPDEFLELLPDWCDGIFIQSNSAAEKLYNKNPMRFPFSMIHTTVGYWRNFVKQHPALVTYIDEPFTYNSEILKKYTRKRWHNDMELDYQITYTDVTIGETFRNMWRVKRAKGLALTSYSNWLFSSKLKLTLVHLLYGEKNRYIWIHITKDERIWKWQLDFCEKHGKTPLLYCGDETDGEHLKRQLIKFKNCK